MPRVVDLSSMLGPGQTIPSNSVTRSAVLRLARMVEYGATLPHDFVQQTLIECTKQSQGKACEGLLWVLKLGDDRIEAYCPLCDEIETIVTGWRNTPWGDGTPQPTERES